MRIVCFIEELGYSIGPFKVYTTLIVFAPNNVFFFFKQPICKRPVATDVYELYVLTVNITSPWSQPGLL